ncbi:hypothetical protein ACTND8_05985 [Atopobiaceae bacterium HCP3S3_F7]
MPTTAYDLTIPGDLSTHDFRQMDKLIRHAAGLSKTTPYATSQLLAFAAKLSADIEAGHWPGGESDD